MKVQSQFIEMFGECQRKEKLSSLCETFIDGDWIESKDQSEDGIRLVQTGNVGYGYFKDKEDKSRYISEETFNRLHCTEIFAGDILVSRLPDPIGRACIIPEGIGRMITAVDCSIIRLKDVILPEYFISYTMTSTYSAQINEVTTGTTRRRVSRANLGNVLVPCPSLEAQRQFVAISQQADKSKFVGLKSQFIEMFAFQDLSLTNPSDDFGKKCYDDTSSATKVPAGDYQNKGRYAIYDQSQDCDIAGYTDSIEGVCNNYPAVLFGDHSRVIKYINQPFYIGADGVKIIRPKEDDLLPEFLYYDLLYHNIPNTGYNRHFKYVKMFKLTEVSIDEQKEFLKIAHQADKSKYYYQIA